MTSIPQQKLFDRFDTLPESLREAIFDEPTTDFIWKTSEDQHIPDEKIYTISKLVGYVFMGFLHPEDLSEEIKNELGIDARVAQTIQDTLNQRIFAPLRADIDKAYLPVSTLEISSAGPKIIQNADIPTSIPAPQPIAVSTATSQTISGTATLKTATSANSNTANAPAPKPNRLSDVGWSRSREAEPVIKLEVSETPKSMGTPSAATAPKTSTPAPKTLTATPSASPAPMGGMGEFARLNAMKKTPPPSSAVPTSNITPPSAPATVTTSVSPTPTSTPSAPAPFILHEDTSFKASEKNTSFTLAKPGSAARIPLTSTIPQAPVRPAVLEFGKAGQPSATKPPVATSSIPSKMVHYTEFNSPSLSSVPTANTGPRTISEIAPSAPKAPATPPAITPQVAPAIPVPMPPQPPKIPTTSSMPSASPAATVAPVLPNTQKNSLPPQNQSSQPAEKVIVKDFL